MVRLMVGREVSRFCHRNPHTPGDIVLIVNQLRTTMFPQQTVSFSLRTGEVVGLAGLISTGQSELIGTLFGVTPAVGGGMKLIRWVRSQRTAVQSMRWASYSGQKTRRRAGLVLPISVKWNLSLASLQQFSTPGHIARFSQPAG